VLTELLNPLLSLRGPVVYVVVGLLVFGETAIMVGFVLPGEIAAILGGVLAGQHHASFGVLVAVVVVAAIAGDTVGYALGAVFGNRLLALPLLRRRARMIDFTTELLRRRGTGAVILGRFTAFLRAMVPGMAGMSEMPYRRFVVANSIGGLLWGVTFTLLGYAFSSAYTKVERYAGWASDALIVLVAAAVAAMWIVVRRRERRMLEGAAGSEADGAGEPASAGSVGGVPRIG
jgi:membrane-associated protein